MKMNELMIYQVFPQISAHVVILIYCFRIEQVMGNVVIWQHLLCYKKVNKKNISCEILHTGRIS